MNVGLVVPCFNEADRWNSQYWAELTSIPQTMWLFVNDGSTDQTAAILREFAATSRVRVATLEGNAGKSEAVRQGMQILLDEAGPLDAVGFIDADGAFATDDVIRIINTFSARVAQQQAYDTVWSSRVALAGRSIERSTSRHYLGRGVATVLSLGWPGIPYDTQSGFKLFAPTPQFRRCLTEPMETRWFVDMELLARWTREAGRSIGVWEEPLMSWHDVRGSKVRLRHFATITRELAYIKRNQFVATRALRECR